MKSPKPQLTLGISGFTFADLYDSFRLRDLLLVWEDHFKQTDHENFHKFEDLRASGGVSIAGVPVKYNEKSAVLMSAGKAVETFVIKLFGIEEATSHLHAQLFTEKKVMLFKSDFLKRATLRKKDKPSDTSIERWNAHVELYNEIKTKTSHLDWTDEESALASVVYSLNRSIDNDIHPDAVELLGGHDNPTERIKTLFDKLEDYYFLRKILYPETMKGWMSMRNPRKLDFEHLVHVERPNQEIPELMSVEQNHLRRRDGFKLTDRRSNLRDSMGEIEYCMICHEREKDSCSKGMREKDGTYKINPLGIKITGCPLDEHISEMHALKSDGFSIGALGMITINNPMCAGTGHRICNDCMKGCIFQKQEPVNIPKVETSILTDVLSLPWGFEIYALLTRWNPLKFERPYALPYNGKNVAVVGLGPAGYTLSQHLLNEGFAVVGIDGLKIEPLPANLTGKNGAPPEPVYDYHAEIEKELDERVLEGFGGVSEYGITVRWDKNFLTVLHLMLERRATFKVLDGVRFGGTMTIDDAWELGFDHIAIAAGAGKPTIVNVKNNLSRGIRKASDFLMTLQLSGAAKKESLSNLQIRLPALVIGGGLTGIDTTTESMAYYPIQVEKFYKRSAKLIEEMGEESFFAMYDTEEQSVAREFIAHGQAIIAERERAESAGETPNFIPLLQSWGGVTMAYRKRLQDSPAYRLNHEEVEMALQEGIYVMENMSPIEAKLDEYGAVCAMVFERQIIDENGKHINSGEMVEIPAKSIFVAAGTSPNTMYEKEYPNTFQMDKRGQYFQAFELV